jgi:hypothetical protein
MAAREAWLASGGSSGRSRAWLPLDFAGRALLHAGLCALHLLDLPAAPIHLVAGEGPPEVYEPFDFPMELHAGADLADEAGELALYGIAGSGGAAISWWLGSVYLPGIFSSIF